jgi:hypothetical protein
MEKQTVSAENAHTQTAVEWFFDKLKNHEIQAEHFQFYQQAIAMEKEQILNTYLSACDRLTPYGYYGDSAEQYYNETYNK